MQIGSKKGQYRKRLIGSSDIIGEHSSKIYNISKKDAKVSKTG